jgi:hypothetical protein
VRSFPPAIAAKFPEKREGIKFKFAIFLLEIGLAFDRNWSVTDSTGALLGIGISPRSGEV